ncbi:UDP-glucose--hexose-1-phosphate uridylyltransferase [Paenibacillus sp. CC-CFT747]|nr:UDP-glucose--hexose-1-phosphate uridylyltransferase [Paenibacillus sp. CC-CFT747]
MESLDIKREIARLVRFAEQRGMIEREDRIPATNALLDLLQVEEPFAGELPDEQLESPVEILDRILDYAAAQGLMTENTTTRRDLLDARLMGLLMPRQSEVARRFWRTAEEESIEKATDDYYRLSMDSNYIRMDRIRNNLYWRTPTPYGELEITINLSKPEKDPKDIAAERALPQSQYPKCLLCLENVGYAGRLNHPARQNHRVIPLRLDGAPWYLQYSPYVYYNEHSIVFSEAHTPMQISRQSFVRLLDFVRTFPHYFIGSNADLPIVGGSILSHDHFQGGRHRFPMELAPVEAVFTHPGFPAVKAGLVHWPMSVIRLAADDKEPLVELADRLLSGWRAYSDESVGIRSHSEIEGTPVPHNTITPIARRNQDGQYELDLVLRNNRTSEEHPLGIFHPHADLHHVKKENIGLIEVMGLAVLPGRLKEELEAISDYLTGGKSDWEGLQSPEHPLHQHAPWIRTLVERYGTGLDREQARQVLQDEIGGIFLRVLMDAGVYKRNEEGNEAFRRFMTEMGFH